MNAEKKVLLQSPAGRTTVPKILLLSLIAY